MSHPGNRIPLDLLDKTRKPGTPPASPVTLLADGFEGNLYWQHSATGPDDVCAISGAQFHAGANSLLLATRHTGPAAGDALAAWRDFDWCETELLTESYWVYLPAPAELAILWFWIQCTEDPITYHPHIAWDLTTGEGYYFDDTGSPIAVPDLDHAFGAAAWHKLTLAINVQTKRYVLASAGADVADLTGILFQASAAGGPHNMQVEIGFQTAGAAPAHVYVDDTLITYTIP
jgi:hypothetical protein